MKKTMVGIVHSLFRISFFEKILRLLVKGHYTTSMLVKFVPPNRSYPKGQTRVVREGELVLFGNLGDYNDWKAYWGIKEIEREKLYKLADSARIIVDVGVNNGWVLLNLSQIIKKNDGFVYGFEPHPDTYQRCTRNIGESRVTNCKVFNMGCGDRDGELQMISEKESNSGQNRIVQGKESLEAPNAVTVKVTTLDRELKDAGKVDLIKIDVEGFELNVLKGAVNILTRHKPVLFMEIDDKLLKSNQTSPAEILNFLETGFGYRFTHASSGKKINTSDNFSGCHFDVICIPG